MKIRFSVLFSALVLSTAVVTPSFAQECVTQQVGQQAEGVGSKLCAAAGAVNLSGVSGALSLVRAGQVVPVTADTLLSAGDRIIVRRGSANFSIGPSCLGAIGANSSLSIVKSGNQLCVQGRSTALVRPEISGIQPPAPTPSIPAPPAPAAVLPVVETSMLPYLVGGALVVGGGIAAVGLKSSNSGRLSP